MSLLVKGMEMPKGSSNLVKTAYPCDLVISKDGKHELVERGARYSCYEISTPHGRLIDADELLKQFQPDEDELALMRLIDKNTYYDAKKLIEVAESTISEAPTIIEAEGGE